MILGLSDPTQVASLVRNAGSVFLGYFSPESVGDYASGTNHVLPTNGFARTLSGLGLHSFTKRTTFQKLSFEGLRNIGPTVAALTSAEGLDSHRNAITIRIKDSIGLIHTNYFVLQCEITGRRRHRLNRPITRQATAWRGAGSWGHFLPLRVRTFAA